MNTLTTSVSSPLDVLSQTEQCVVCGDSADGFHYGVRSCRGCNAFFRRAITFEQQFNCRRGGKCPVDKNARCACRACRLAKCLAVGMDRKAVQPKRENGVAEHTTVIKSEPSPEVRSLPRSGSLDDLFMPALPPSPPPDCGLISRQCYDYKDQKRRRRAMLCDTLAEILSDDCEGALRRRSCADDYSAIFQVQMVLMFEWAEKLPEFRTLTDPMDKTKLLRAFALRYILLDNVFHTMELGYTDRLVLVNNTYMKPGDWPPFDPADSQESRQVQLQMFGSETQELLDDIVVPMVHNRLTPGEMMALRMIMFWNPGGIGLSHDGLETSQTASNNAVRELHVYFEVERIDQIDNRIGSLLLLLPCFTKHVQYLYNTVKLIPSFGQMKEWDSFMDELLRGF